MTTANGWVRTMSRMDVAEEFSRFLEQHCVWSLDDFGGQYPWDDRVPAKCEWDNVTRGMNNHLKMIDHTNRV